MKRQLLHCSPAALAIILFFPIFVIHCSTGQAQVGTLNLINAPVSPNAAALGKFVEIPVSYYSGIPGISIPLYELNVKGTAIPLSLSYHASGIKLKEVAGPVGCGWALNAGGIITRIVRGFPDDHDPSTGPNDGDDIEGTRIRQASTNGFTSVYNLDERYQLMLSKAGIDAEIESNTELRQQFPYFPRRMDTEMDLFYFNFGKHTGQFTFTNEGTPLLLTRSDLKIEYSNKKFKITDGEGVQYFFDSTEQSLDEGSNVRYLSEGRMYTTSWYLSKIHIPYSNQTVTFSYRRFWNYDLYPSSLNYAYIVAFRSRVDRIRWFYQSIQNFASGPVPSCLPHNQFQASTAPHFFANALFISSIQWDDKKIIFYGDTNRIDTYKYKLDSIRVMAGPQLVKTIQLQYNYFNATASDPAAKKLQLEKVQIADQEYQFNYIESLFGKTLPAITAKGQDLWGYYNGEDDETGIPYFKVFDYPTRAPDLFYYLSNTTVNSTLKNPDHKYGQIGLLNAITYPTGGRTVFTYEGNDYSKFPFVHPDSTIVSDPYTQIKFRDNYGKAVDASTIPGATPASAIKEREFVAHQDQQVNIFLLMGQYRFNSYQHYIDSAYNRFFPRSRVYLKKYNTGTGQFDNIYSYDVNPRDTIGLPPSQFYYDQVYYRAMVQKNFSFVLAEGRYKIRVELTGWRMRGSMGIELLFPYKRSDSIYNAGGMRIKKIAFLSGAGPDSSYVKHFDYTNGNLSTGVLESPFANISESWYYGGYRDWTDAGGFLRYQQGACGFFNLSSDPVIPLGNAQGGVIGYAQVTEIRKDNSKIKHHFTSGADHRILMTDQFVQSNIVPTRTRLKVDNSWKRGLPKQSDYYNASGQLVRQEFSKYLYDESKVYKSSTSMYLDEIRLYPGGEHYTFGGYQVVPGFITRGHQNVFKTEDSTVEYAGAAKLTAVTKYEYHPSGLPHPYPVKITSRNSLGQVTITQLKYPQDYGNSIGAAPAHPLAVSVKNLLDQHTVSPVVEKYIQKQDENGANLRTIGGQLVRYKLDRPLPDTVFTLHTTTGLTNFSPAVIGAQSSTKDSRYSPDLVFSTYDGYGNITEQSRAGNVKEAFLWGYSLQYPVAKITGSDYTTARQFINQTILDNMAGLYSDQQIRNELNKIRTGLEGTQALVSTYTYRPLIGMTSETGPDGRTVFYEYDAMGRLRLVKDQDNKVLRMICYNYAGNPENCELTFYTNTVRSGNFTRSNCPPGESGSTVTYTVPEGKYSSSISQAAADQQAQNDMDANGQNYADTSGTCAILPVTIVLQNTFQVYPFPRTSMEFIQNGISVQSNSFPNAQSGSATYSLPPGTYQLRFTVPRSWEDFFFSYVMMPGGFHWDKGLNKYVVTTGNVTFTGGTTYTITAIDNY